MIAAGRAPGRVLCHRLFMEGRYAFALLSHTTMVRAVMPHSVLVRVLVACIVPLTIATLVAHRILHMNPIIICGGLAGAMTVDAAITGACERADSQTPVLGVAVPYAVGNVLLTVLGPVIVAVVYAG